MRTMNAFIQEEALKHIELRCLGDQRVKGEILDAMKWSDWITDEEPGS